MPESAPVFSSREWLTPVQVAERSGFCLDLVRVAYRRGELPSVKKGNTPRAPIRIPVEAFDAWMVGDQPVLRQIRAELERSRARVRAPRSKAAGVGRSAPQSDLDRFACGDLDASPTEAA